MSSISPPPKRPKRQAAIKASKGLKQSFEREIQNKKIEKMQNSVIRRMKSSQEKHEKEIEVIYSKYKKLQELSNKPVETYQNFIQNPPHRFRKVTTLRTKLGNLFPKPIEEIGKKESITKKTSGGSKSFVSWMLFDKSTKQISEIPVTPVHTGISFFSKYLPIRWGIPGVSIKSSNEQGLVRGVVGPVKNIYAKNNKNVVSGGVSYHDKSIPILNNYLNFKPNGTKLKQRLIVNKFVGPSVDNLSTFVFDEKLNLEIRRDALNYKIAGDRFTATTAGMISKNNNILAIKPYDIDIAQNIAAYKWIDNNFSKENIARKIATKIQNDDNIVFTHACVTTNDRPLVLYCILTNVDVFVDNSAFPNGSYAYIKSYNDDVYSGITIKEPILNEILKNKNDLNYHAIFDAFHDFGKSARLSQIIKTKIEKELLTRNYNIIESNLIVEKLRNLLLDIYSEKYHNFIRQFTSKGVIDRIENSVIDLIKYIKIKNPEVVEYLLEPPNGVCVVDDNFPQDKSRPWRNRIISHAQRLQDGWSGVRLSMNKIKNEYSK